MTSDFLFSDRGEIEEKVDRKRGRRFGCEERAKDVDQTTSRERIRSDQRKEGCGANREDEG